MRPLLLLLCSLFLGSLSPLQASCQTGSPVMFQTADCDTLRSFLPDEGAKARYTFLLEHGKAGLSGMCVMYRQKGVVRCSFFNEFGVSAVTYSYSLDRHRVSLHHVWGPLDRWLVRRMLKKQLKGLMHELQQGKLTYTDRRHSTTYVLQPVK